MTNINRRLAFFAGATAVAAISAAKAQTIQSPPPINLPSTFVAAPTEAGVRAARATAVAAGGGVVYLPDATITLTATLPCDTGVYYIGVPPRFTWSTSLTEVSWSFSGGTVFQGDGTFPAFSANTTPKGSPDANFLDNAVADFGLENIGFTNFTNAVSIGAKNNAGLIFSWIRNIYVNNCTDFAVKFINFHHADFDGITNNNCTHGQYYACDVALSVLQMGNSNLKHLVHQGVSASITGRGLVFEALDSASLDNTNVDRLQAITFNRSQISQAATMVNLSTTIGVTDGTKFVVGLPVTVSATANGFTAGQVYVVLSVAGNNLTLGNSKNASAIAATGNSATNITSWGMPHIEIRGDATSTVQNCDFLGMDAEGPSTANIYAEKAANCLLDISSLTISNSTVQICGRNMAYSYVRSFFATAVDDFDGNSATSKFFGARGTIVQRTLSGIWNDNIRNTSVLAIVGGNAGNVADFEIRTPAGNFIYPIAGIGKHVKGSNATSQALSPSFGSNCLSYLNGSGGTWTLPTIVTDASNPVNASNIGFSMEITVVGAGTLTVNTDGSQTFNMVAAKTSTTVTTAQTLIVTACKASDGTLFWAAYLGGAIA